MTIDTLACSVPGCRKAATHDVSAPWSIGDASGSRSYGRACPDHPQAVIASAQHRLLRSSLEVGEAIGELVATPRDGLEVGPPAPARLAAR